jgi:hypothetical protein
MLRIGCSSEWAIRTLVGVMTHEVPLPSAPTVGVRYHRQVNIGMFMRLIRMVGLRTPGLYWFRHRRMPYVKFRRMFYMPTRTCSRGYKFKSREGGSQVKDRYGEPERGGVNGSR